MDDLARAKGVAVIWRGTRLALIPRRICFAMMPGEDRPRWLLLATDIATDLEHAYPLEELRSNWRTLDDIASAYG